MSRLRSRPLVAIAVLLAAVLVAAGCGDDDSSSSTSSADLGLIQDGQLKVGSDIPYPPFEFGRAPDYKGFDVDVVNEVAKRLDLDAEFIKTPFDPIFRNLAQGRFDMVASAATITPEREGTVAFSVPYFAADQSLMIKKGSDIKTEDDLEGKIVGAQLGTTGADVRQGQDEGQDGADLRPDRRRLQGAPDRPGRGRDQRLPGVQVRRAVEARPPGGADGSRPARSTGLRSPRRASPCGRPCASRSTR